MAAIMDVDENLKQTYIQYDPAPRKGNEVQKKRVPDYFLWNIISQFHFHYFPRIIHWMMFGITNFIYITNGILLISCSADQRFPQIFIKKLSKS